MRNEALTTLSPLLGDWKLTMTNAWFLDSLETEVHGSATIDWLGDSFIRMRSELGGDPAWDFVIGRSDARDEFVVLYHDERGVCRVFRMTFDAGEWSMLREDPDFHQRWVGTVEGDRISSHADASEDGGQTWRTDLDVIFERVGPPRTEASETRPWRREDRPQREFPGGPSSAGASVDR